MLAAVHHEIAAPPRRRRHLRRGGIGLFAVAAIGGGGLAAYAATSHEREPSVAGQVGCNRSAALYADTSIVSVGAATAATAIAACSDQWSRLWPTTPKPVNFAACVYPEAKGQSGGALFVIPADAGADNNAACTAIGADILPS